MSANDPAMLQLPGLLAAVVNDALRDGVPVAAIVGELEVQKVRLVIRELDPLREAFDPVAQVLARGGAR